MVIGDSNRCTDKVAKVCQRGRDPHIIRIMLDQCIIVNNAVTLTAVAVVKWCLQEEWGVQLKSLPVLITEDENASLESSVKLSNAPNCILHCTYIRYSDIYMDPNNLVRSSQRW